MMRFSVVAISVVLITAVVLTAIFARVAIVPDRLGVLEIGGAGENVSGRNSVLIDTDAYRANDPQLGDVVAVRSPSDAAGFTVQRVVGLPGDTIEVWNSRLYVNGAPFGPINADPFGPWQVPAEIMLLVGEDGALACVPRDRIAGRVWLAK